MNEGDGGVFPVKMFILVLIIFPLFIALFVYYVYSGLWDPLLAGLGISLVLFLFGLSVVIPLLSVLEQVLKERKKEKVLGAV